MEGGGGEGNCCERHQASGGESGSSHSSLPVPPKQEPQATIMSINGVGPNDLNSWNAILEGLLRMEGGSDLPFVRCFFWSASTYLWEDGVGTTSASHKGKDGSKATSSCQEDKG